jgi:uncharacterized Zn finger protein
MMEPGVAGAECHPANLSPSDIGDNTRLNSLTAWQLKLYWSKLTDNFDAGDESRGHDYRRRGKVVSARWADDRSALLDASVAGFGGNVYEQSIELIAEGGAASALGAEDLKALFEPLS